MKTLSILVALAAVVPPGAFAQNMFRGNPAHTGVYDTAGPKTLQGVKWAFHTGGPIVTSPALAGSMAFIGSDDEFLYAIDTAGGHEKWKFKTDGPIRSSAAVEGGVVYFGSYDGVFYAVDAATGQLKWKFQTPGERRFEAKGLHGFRPATQTIPDLWDTWQSSPAVVNNVVYFGNGTGNVYALDAASGELKWKFATGNVVHASPAVVDGVVYAGSWDGYLYALDAATGAEKWRFKTKDDPKIFNHVGIQGSPAVVNGMIYFGCRDAHLYAVDAKTGKEVWNFDNHGTWINGTPAVVDGTLYVGASIPGNFIALDAATGKSRYVVSLYFPLFSSPAIASGMAYFGSYAGKLNALDLQSGTIAWQFQTDSSKKNEFGLIAPNGSLDFSKMSQTGYFEETYRDVERLFALGTILSSPAVENGVVYFGSTDGNFYALN